MFAKILEYQKIEGDIISLENKLNKSAEREKAVQLQQVLRSQQARFVALEANAKKYNEAYLKAVAKFEEYSKKLEELEKQATVVDADKIDLYEKAYKDFAAVANSLEKEISKLHVEIQQTTREFQETRAKYSKDLESFGKYKAVYSKQKAEIEPKIDEAKKQLAALQKEIDAKLMQKYNQKREGKVFPVFVKLNVNMCGRCGVEFPATKLIGMKNSEFGTIECESCGRISFSN